MPGSAARNKKHTGKHQDLQHVAYTIREQDLNEADKERLGTESMHTLERELRERLEALVIVVVGVQELNHIDCFFRAHINYTGKRGITRNTALRQEVFGYLHKYNAGVVVNRSCTLLGGNAEIHRLAWMDPYSFNRHAFAA